MNGISLWGGVWNPFTEFITGIFAIIPQFIYFFYTCFASLLDMLQFVLRKLAGLDTYYINGVEKNDDILTEFINGILGLNGHYSALTTVFWALIIFGLIVLILSIIIAIIKAHYNYDESKAKPSAIIGKGLKSLATLAIVPLVAIFGVYLSNVLLRALDNITASSSSQGIADVFKNSSGSYSETFKSSEDEWGNQTYVSYDFFGSYAPTGSQTFSGIMFRIAANDANRVRYGGYTASEAGESWSDFGIFNSTLSSESQKSEDIATMIDYSFANNLTLKSKQTASVRKEESAVLISSFRYLRSAIWYAGTINFDNFSKYNVGLVWYFYNLWSFNFFLGFIGIIIALTFMTNIVFGLMVRLLECTALFLCLGPLVAIMPLDNEFAFKEWRRTFSSDVLMVYGAVIGMNLLFIFLPYLQRITFFNQATLNYIMDMLIMIVGLLAVKQIVALISNFVGGSDANAVGKGAKAEPGQYMLKGAQKLAAGAVIGAKFAKFIPGLSAAAKGIEKLAKKIQQFSMRKAMAQRASTGSAEVSEAMHERIRKQELEDLEKQKKDLEDEENELKLKSDLNHESADEADKKAQSAKKKEDKEKQASKDQTNDFKSWLVNRYTADFDQADNEKDKKLADNLAKEYGARVAAINRKKTLSTKQKNQERLKVLDEITDNYAQNNTHAKKAKKAEDKRVQYEKIRDGFKTEYEKADQELANRDFEKQKEEIEKKIQEVSTAKVLDGYKIKQKPKEILKHTLPKLNFAGEVLQAFGGVFDFGDLVKQIDNEGEVFDMGKKAIRSFGQKILGIDLSKAKSLQLSDEAKQEEAEKTVERTDLGLKENSEKMLNEAKNLSQILRNSRNNP